MPTNRRRPSSHVAQCRGHNLCWSCCKFSINLQDNHHSATPPGLHVAHPSNTPAAIMSECERINYKSVRLEPTQIGNKIARPQMNVNCVVAIDRNANAAPCSAARLPSLSLYTRTVHINLALVARYSCAMSSSPWACSWISLRSQASRHRRTAIFYNRIATNYRI